MRNHAGQLVLDIGDVLRSPRFAHGFYRGLDREVIWIGLSPAQDPDLTMDDPSRGTAEFVVEETVQEPRSGSHNAIYKGGLKILLRRLHSNGTYNPNGERIAFYVSGDTGPIINTHLTQTGKMEPTFTRIAPPNSP